VTLCTAAIGAAPGEPVTSKPRRSFTADQKAAFLRRHHIDKVPVSQLCEENDLQPSLFYYWQRQLFENAANALQSPGAGAPSKALEAKVEALEKQVAKKDEVIAWVAEEHVKLKKTLGAA
jgi:transposase-like protein